MTTDGNDFKNTIKPQVDIERRKLLAPISGKLASLKRDLYKITADIDAEANACKLCSECQRIHYDNFPLHVAQQELIDAIKFISRLLS